MKTSFEKFKETLSKKQQEVLEQVLEEETEQKAKEIISSMNHDQKHLELVNFCANFFVTGQEIPEKTGYSLAMVEPLYSLKIKNFDLGLFRLENSSLVLIECKSSVSDFGNLMDDLKKTIETSNSNRKEIEKILGNKIEGTIEFALCLPAVDASVAYKESVKKEVPVCIWAASQFKSKIRLFNSMEDTKVEVNAGRLHRDGKLSSLLSHGIKSKSRAIRPIAILPSSHMGTLIVYVSDLIFKSCKDYGKEFDFVFSDIYNILDKDLRRFTSMTNKDFEKLTENILKVALRKGIFIDMTSDIPELRRKTFQIKGRRQNLEIMRRNIEEVYVQHNAKEKAKLNIPEKFREKTGTKDLGKYLFSN